MIRAARPRTAVVHGDIGLAGFTRVPGARFAYKRPSPERIRAVLEAVSAFAKVSPSGRRPRAGTGTASRGTSQQTTCTINWTSGLQANRTKARVRTAQT